MTDQQVAEFKAKMAEQGIRIVTNQDIEARQREESRVRLDSIQVKIHHDDITDPGDSECYTKEQLNDFGSVWWYLGIQAEAEVSYPIGNSSDRRLERLSSGGLWGIESESGERYVVEVMREELKDLKKHLEVFGVSSPNFDQLAEKAVEEAL